MGTVSAEGPVLSLQQRGARQAWSWAGVCSVGGPMGQTAEHHLERLAGLEASLSWSGDGHSPACLSQVLTAGGRAGQLCEDLGDLCGVQDRGLTVSPIQTSPSGAAVRLQPPNQAGGPYRQLCSVSAPSETGQRVSQGVPAAQVLQAALLLGPRATPCSRSVLHGRSPEASGHTQHNLANRPVPSQRDTAVSMHIRKAGPAGQIGSSGC